MKNITPIDRLPSNAIPLNPIDSNCAQITHILTRIISEKQMYNLNIIFFYHFKLIGPRTPDAVHFCGHHMAR